MIYYEVTEIIEIGEGSRVCIDFADVIEPDEGAFVGNTSAGYVFVLSENRQAVNYKPRPFRINAGAVHQYVLLGEKTAYLSDIVPGTKITLFNKLGSREVTIGRVKIEKRNFVRLVAKADENEISATLQLVESVYLMEESRGIIPLTELKIGDAIKCYADKPGRHLGDSIEEYIVEK